MERNIAQSQETANDLIQAWLMCDPQRFVSVANLWRRKNLHLLFIPGVNTKQIEVFLESGGLVRMSEGLYGYEMPQI